MDKKYTSHKEVSDYVHDLIRDKSEKELKKLDPLELLETIPDFQNCEFISRGRLICV